MEEGRRKEPHEHESLGGPTGIILILRWGQYEILSYVQAYRVPDLHVWIQQQESTGSHFLEILSKCP